MQANPKLMEIVGKPGKAWGSVIVPASGTITLKITGSVIQATIQDGFEKTTSWTRIQNIDSIEMAEAPNYLLLVVGCVLALTGLGTLARGPILGLMILAVGILCMVLAFQRKRRLLVIHSLRYTIPVFMTKPSDGYQQFTANIMAIAHQLSTLPPGSQLNRPKPARPAAVGVPQSINAK